MTSSSSSATAQQRQEGQEANPAELREQDDPQLHTGANGGGAPPDYAADEADQVLSGSASALDSSRARTSAPAGTAAAGTAAAATAAATTAKVAASDEFFEIVPSADATSFQVGYLGLPGFQAWIKGDVLVKLDEPTRRARKYRRW